MRDIFVKTLFNIAIKDPNVLLVTGDLGFGVLNPFWEHLPNQIINVGIAEQNMLGFAAGLALQEKIVYVYSIGNFPTLRALEQVRNDVAYHNLNVKIVSVGAGFSYGSLGITHHATEDIGIMRSIPNIKIYSPSDGKDAEFITNLSYKLFGPSYIRIGRNIKDNNLVGFSELSSQFPRSMINNSKYAVFTTGEIAIDVVKVVEHFRLKKISFDMYVYHILKPINADFLNNIILKYTKVFIIEEHNKYGGLSSIIKDHLSHFQNIKIHSLSINDVFTSEVGDQNYLRKINGLDIYSIIDNIRNLIGD